MMSKKKKAMDTDQEGLDRTELESIKRVSIHDLLQHPAQLLPHLVFAFFDLASPSAVF